MVSVLSSGRWSRKFFISFLTSSTKPAASGYFMLAVTCKLYPTMWNAIVLMQRIHLIFCSPNSKSTLLCSISSFDNLMARNSYCISAVTAKSVLIWDFLSLPEHSSESFVLIANLCRSSEVDFLLPSSELHYGTQANFPLKTSKIVNISLVNKCLSNWCCYYPTWSVPTAYFRNTLSWILWWWAADSWVHQLPFLQRLHWFRRRSGKCVRQWHVHWLTKCRCWDGAEYLGKL